MLGDIDDLRTFVTLVDQGGLSAAVDTLGMPKSTLSRKLASLESRVGGRLLDRNARTFRLTEKGKTLYAYAARILAEVEQLKEALQPDEPSGLLRVTTTFGVATNVLIPILPEFLRLHPKIDVDLEASSQLRDLTREDFDVALRAGPLSGGSLTAKRLGKTELGLYATPAFLKNNALTPETLDLRPTLHLNRSGRRYHGPDGISLADRRPRCRLTFNDPMLMKTAVLTDFGSAWMPVHMCRDDVTAGHLVRCRPEESISGNEVFALFQKTKDMSAKIRLFIDFLADHLILD
jgi:DNA-binding transcriptional LysR family regulator